MREHPNYYAPAWEQKDDDAAHEEWHEKWSIGTGEDKCPWGCVLIGGIPPEPDNE